MTEEGEHILKCGVGSLGFGVPVEDGYVDDEEHGPLGLLTEQRVAGG